MEQVRAALLRGVADAARAALDARASSIALVDPRTGDLVFEAVAGHVVQSGVALVVDDLARDPRFAHDIAVETGYEPDALAAAPIRRGGAVVGVLSVLDPGEPPPGGAAAVLEALCAHATAALELGDAVGG